MSFSIYPFIYLSNPPSILLAFTHLSTAVLSTTHLSTHPSTPIHACFHNSLTKHPSIHFSVYPLIYLSLIHPSMHSSSIYLSIFTSTHTFICLCMLLSIYSSKLSSIYPTIHSSTHLFIHQLLTEPLLFSGSEYKRNIVEHNDFDCQELSFYCGDRYIYVG